MRPRICLDVHAAHFRRDGRRRRETLRRDWRGDWLTDGDPNFCRRDSDRRSAGSCFDGSFRNGENDDASRFTDLGGNAAGMADAQIRRADGSQTHNSLRCRYHDGKHHLHSYLSHLKARVLAPRLIDQLKHGELTMRNKRFFIVLAGALIFGLLAAVSVTRYLSSAQAYTKNLNRVAVAKVAIPHRNQNHS